MKPILLTGLLALTLVACSDDDNNPATDAHAYEGIWQAPAYGEVLVVERDRIDTYQYSSGYCVLAEQTRGISLAEMEAAVALADDGQSFSIPVGFGTRDFHAPANVYDKVDALPASCLQPVALRGEAGYQQDYSRDFAMFWQSFDEMSVAFEKVSVDWAALREDFAPQAAAATSDLDLLEVYFELTKPLADGHVTISAPGIGTASTNGKPVQFEVLLQEYASLNGLSVPLDESEVDGFIAYYSEQIARYENNILQYADSEDDIRTAANDMLIWFEVEDVVYLNIAAMTGFDDEDDNAASLAMLNAGLDTAMADIRDARGLIIDIRSNNGGNDFISLAIASRFADIPRHVYSKQARLGHGRTELVDVTLTPAASGTYTGPTVLLTSNSTFSAAETFALCLRAQPHVTLMGEATQGALSDMLERALPNGFSYTLSNEYYLSPEGDWFEGVGIPVDIEVPTFTRAQREAGEDLALEQAFAYVTGQ